MTENGRPVDWGRFDEYRHAVEHRLEVVEGHLEELRGQTAQHQALNERIVRLEQYHSAESERSHKRTDRIWFILGSLFVAVASSIIVSTIVTVFHIRAAG